MMCATNCKAAQMNERHAVTMSVAPQSYPLADIYQAIQCSLSSSDLKLIHALKFGLPHRDIMLSLTAHPAPHKRESGLHPRLSEPRVLLNGFGMCCCDFATGIIRKSFAYFSKNCTDTFKWITECLTTSITPRFVLFCVFTPENFLNSLPAPLCLSVTLSKFLCFLK